VIEAINDLNRKFEHLFGTVLQPVTWEAFRPAVEAEKSTSVQEPITRRLAKCLWFVGILNRRYGTPVDDAAGRSGTHEEFMFALEHREQINILSYFRDDPRTAETTDDIEQIDLLNRLKSDLRSAHVRYVPYQTPDEFGKRILLDLMEAFLEIVTDLRRKEFLGRFFRFGVRKREREPSVLIAYPPIHKHLRSDYDWKSRLVPNVVYEDFKAIQKLEAALMSLGVVDYGSITVPNEKLDPPGNRIWLCISRNDVAARELRALGNRARFTFEPATDAPAGRYLTWRQRDQLLRVQSPLHHYLTLQRPAKRALWDRSYGRIIARDYAVISRFRVADADRHTSFYHYYVAGIRGLGTWGAGWYVDRCYEDLASASDAADTEDVQILVETTFSNFRIREVRNVSNEPKEFFDLRSSEEFIRAEIAEWRSGSVYRSVAVR
jgi:hypothetical protein